MEGSMQKTANEMSMAGFAPRRLCLRALGAWPLWPLWPLKPSLATPADAQAGQAQGAQAQGVPFQGVPLALDWPAGRSPQGFLVSEKFDGVRALWDGRTLRFRSGRTIAAPAAFLQTLPQCALDGELWLAHGEFDRLSALVRQQRGAVQAWGAVIYQVFDAPQMPGPFEARWQALQEVLASAAQPGLRAVEQIRLADAAALQQRLDEVVRSGGEGLMLHRADALWRPGRSDALYKLKEALDDEAQVVAHLPGQGRLAGMTGALLVRTPEGLQFALGSGLSQAQRQKPPELGSWVTYRYRDRTPGGVPRFATFVRVRPPE
jgi:DNA ligase-1